MWLSHLRLPKELHFLLHSASQPTSSAIFKVSILDALSFCELGFLWHFKICQSCAISRFCNNSDTFPLIWEIQVNSTHWIDFKDWHNFQRWAPDAFDIDLSSTNSKFSLIIIMFHISYRLDSGVPLWMPWVTLLGGLVALFSISWKISLSFTEVQGVCLDYHLAYIFLQGSLLCWEIHREV